MGIRPAWDVLQSLSIERRFQVAELIGSVTMRWRIFFICCIVAVTCWASRHYSVDDALIYARYIRNALDGHGLVFNEGERVNALTSPFFTALLLAASWLLRGHIILAEFILGGVFLAAACAVAERLVPWSGLLIASTAYFYSCLGMETPLFLLILSLLTLFYLEERLNWLPFIAILTILTRLEGAALVAVIAVKLLREKRRPSMPSYLPAVLALAADVIFNRAFYGSWLPSSTTAKFGQGFSGYWGRWPTAFLQLDPLKPIFRPTKYLLPPALAFMLWGLWKERASTLSSVLLPFSFILGAFYVLFNIPDYHWYYAPFIFFVALYAVRGVPRTMLAHACLILAVVFSFAASVRWMSRTSGLQTTGLPNYMAMGNWIRLNSKPDARVAAVETGTLGWYDDRYTDDIIGLTNPANARRLQHHDLTSWLDDQKPDYVVMHETPILGETAAAQSSDYVYVPVHFGPIYLMKRKDTTR
jgi:hypothetical protein